MERDARATPIGDDTKGTTHPSGGETGGLGA
jgi:hypothetical protein